VKAVAHAAARVGVVPLFVVAPFLFVGCAQKRPSVSATLASAAAPDSAAERRLMLMGAFAPSARETVQTVQEFPTPEPTAEFESLEAVRDSIESILRRSMSPADTAIHFSRGSVSFRYHYARVRTPALAIHVVVTDTSMCPQTLLADALTRSGWIPNLGYQADGTDGEVMAFVTRTFMCVVEGEWDGGDDTDSTYVPAPGCKLTVTCAPRRADDVPPE
jgi:hypothetical protein